MTQVENPIVSPSGLIIRRLRDDERPAFTALAKRSLPHLMERVTFSLSPDSFVAEQEGNWVGGLVLKLNTFGGQRWGEVSWVFTAPEARGLGAGQQLIDHALAFFDEQKVDGVYTYVEGDNASSFKLFTTRGFARAALSDQWSRFGLNLLAVWFKSGFAFVPAHFFYIRPAQPQPHQGWLHLSAAILFPTLCLMLGAWSWPVPFLTGVVYAFLASLLFIGGRAAAMLLAARLVGLPAQFRMTEPLLLFAIPIGFSSGVMPIPGGVYPAAADWRRREVDDKLGVIGFAGALVVVLALWLLVPLGAMGGATRDFALVAQGFFMLGVFDTALPFLKGYAAGRVWNWSKPAWALLLIAFLAWAVVVIAT